MAPTPRVLPHCKRVRLNKQAAPHHFRGLGHIYGTDGVTLDFGTAKFEAPADLGLARAALRIKWYHDNEINIPPVVLTDGARCWVALYGLNGNWFECEGADFATLAPLKLFPWVGFQSG